MAGPLSDQAWAEFCAIAAAAGLRPDAEARAELSAVLFDRYPAFVFDRERVTEARDRAKRMLESLDAFEADYRAQFRLPADAAEQADETVRNAAVKIERDLWWLAGLRRRTTDVWLAAQTQKDANDRKKSVQRAMLYHWLCSIWLDHFSGELTYDRRSGEPSGPLIDFMLAAMRQIMPEDALPKREAMRDNIDRERNEREDLKQQHLAWLRRKAMGV
jgi:hypothetical protein